MKAMFAVLAAATLLAAPASAQVRPQVTGTPGANVTAEAIPTVPGQASLAGVWHLTSPNCARLTLTRDQARHLDGALKMGLCGTPDFNGAELPCSGFQHPNNQFSLVCEHAGGHFVLVGRVVVEEPVLTQRRRLQQSYAPARLLGREHHSYFTGDTTGARLVDYPLTGDRVS